MAFKPNFNVVPTAHVDGSAASVVNATIDSGRKSTVNAKRIPTKLSSGTTVVLVNQVTIGTARVYNPLIFYIPTLTGLGREVLGINSAIAGRRYVPEPVVTVGTSRFEGSITTLPVGYVGQPYNYQYTFLGIGITMSFDSGEVPPGLTFEMVDETTWQVAGIPTAAGSYIFTLMSETESSFGLVNYNVSILLLSLWGDFLLAPGYVGQPYREQWYVDNVDEPVTFTKVLGILPPGLILYSMGEARGQISGSPTHEGIYIFTLRAASPTMTEDKEFSIEVGHAAATDEGTAYVGGN